MSLRLAIPFSAACLVFVGSALALADVPVPEPVLEEHFDDGRDAPFLQRLLQHPYISLVEGEGTDGSNAIRVDYVGFEGGSRRVAFAHALPESLDAATLVFDVRFDRDFQWTQGGKLHGLGPRDPITGGHARREDGWSARMMFLAGGGISSYLYDQNDAVTYGVGDRSVASVFVRDQWHHVRLEVQLNTAGEPDGWVRVYVDEERVVETTGVMFRRSDGDETRIQTLLFSTFHGGNDPSWTPVDEVGEPTVVSAFFDNFAVYANSGQAELPPAEIEDALEKEERRPHFSGSSRRR